MANPVKYPEYSADKDSVDIHVQFTIGAAGAVASVQRARECLPGTAAVVKQAGAGTYRIFLRERWFACTNVAGVVLPASFSASAGNFVTLSNDSSNVAGPFIEIVLRQVTLAAADGGSGDIVKVTLSMLETKP